MLLLTRVIKIVFAIWLATSGIAFAADNGFYVGGSLGQGRPTFDTAGAAPGVALGVDNSSYAYKVFGGYQLNQYFGAELVYANLGEYNFSTGGRVDIHGWGLALVGALPLGKDFSLLGRLGEYRMRESGFGTADNSWSPNFGIGLKYDFNPNLSGRAEVERFTNMGSNTNTISTKANIYTLGLVYKF